jgi:hypothetical protein
MKVENIEPGKLYLDTHNPRFGLADAVNETEALAILVETADLRELWNSISERGFEKFEPLVAMEEDGRLIVLEGNRRLAAVKLLLNPEILSKESPRRKIPEIDPEKLDTCRDLPVVIVKDRAAAAGYIGFKHVNGPARWSSLAKARFGVRFFEALDGLQSPQERMQSLTKQLGDSRGVIIRLLVAFKIVQQSVQLGHFESLGVDQGDIEFSHLYTLINNPESREFIGLPRAPLSEALIVDEPIPTSHHEKMHEVLGWLYGEKSVIKSQGTDRPRLQRVLASSEGIRELRLTGDLAAAETVAGLRNEDWLGGLAKISTLLQKASTDAAIVIDDLSEDDLAQARSILKRVNSQLRQIQAVLPAIQE